MKLDVWNTPLVGERVDAPVSSLHLDFISSSLRLLFNTVLVFGPVIDCLLTIRVPVSLHLNFTINVCKFVCVWRTSECIYLPVCVGVWK